MNIVITMLVTGALSVLSTSLYFYDKENSELRQGSLVMVQQASESGDMLADMGQ